MLARTLATRHKRLPLRARAAQNVVFGLVCTQLTAPLLLLLLLYYYTILIIYYYYYYYV
jgi:hypothetical protein